MAQDAKLLALLDVVIDTYITKGEPIGSKFLTSLEDVDYTTSPLRKDLDQEVLSARWSMKTLVETIGGIVDGVVVWFLKNDEYYYLGINNLLKDELFDEYQATKQLIRFIEEKRIVKLII